MRVHWDNAELTEATLIHGWLWWRREAHVIRPPGLGWYYAIDGGTAYVGRDRDEWLRDKQSSQEELQVLNKAWQRPVKLPQAKVMP